MATKEDSSMEDQLTVSNSKDTKQKEIHYSTYLQLEKILTAQALRSEEVWGQPVHDEHFFILIHQVYELWFKQILVEMDSVIGILGGQVVEERYLLTVASRLNRTVQIMKIMIAQITVLETLTPLDFLEFRGLLAPASGFQSTQFRLMETRLGLKEEDRIKYGQCSFKEMLNGEEVAEVEAMETKMTLVQATISWLEKIPGLEEDGFNFWGQYQKAVEKMLKDSEEEIKTKPSGMEREVLEKDHKGRKEVFDALFSKEEHDRRLERGDVRLSYKAMQGALMVFLYREEPRYHLPFMVLNNLMEIDAHFAKWRHTHVLMVQRMIGSRVGTGGSSGYHYLRATIGDRYRVFADLFNLSTYFMPRDKIPKLTDGVVCSPGSWQTSSPPLKTTPDEGYSGSKESTPV